MLGLKISADQKTKLTRHHFGAKNQPTSKVKYYPISLIPFDPVDVG
jgi:hypothetical protein